MEEFVFAGNRRRWKYLRPVVGATVVGAALWLAVLGCFLLRSPALPRLDASSMGSTSLRNTDGPLALGAETLGR